VRLCVIHSTVKTPFSGYSKGICPTPATRAFAVHMIMLPQKLIQKLHSNYQGGWSQRIWRGSVHKAMYTRYLIRLAKASVSLLQYLYVLFRHEVHCFAFTSFLSWFEKKYVCLLHSIYAYDCNICICMPCMYI